MSQRRKLAILLCVVLVPGLITATVGYGLHLRSAAYRRAAETDLAEWLGMSVSIGEVRPLTPESHTLSDVHVYLSDTGPEVFSCAKAVWRAGTILGGPGLRSGSPVARQRPGTYTLDLSDGWLLVGTMGWTETEYQRMLAGGLGHDFAALGLAEVRIEDIDLRFKHPMTEFAASDTSGIVLFDEHGDGSALLACSHLNGVDVAPPANITLRFTPGRTLVFHEVGLTVPRMPLTALGLERLLERSVSRGYFDGTIRYRQTDEHARVDVTGSVHEAGLEEFTGQLLGGPYHGTIDVDLESAVFTDRELVTLVGRGRVSDLRLGALVPGLVASAEGSGLDLQIDQVRWSDGRLESLEARGGCPALSLDALSAVWGEGAITGHAALNIRSLRVLDDQLHAADVEVLATAPEDAPGLVDRALIARVARAWLGVDLSAALPEHIEYLQLGARLIIEDGQLRILGTHGPEGRTILTVKLFGRPVGIIKQPDMTFNVPDLIGWMRQRASEVDPDRVRDWWEEFRESEESEP